MSGSKTYYVYIMASKRNGTLYIGITNDLVERTTQHQNGQIPGFTQRCRVHRLVHYETFDDPADAIRREKRLKKWNRQWKIRLIERGNPRWRDLHNDLAR